MRLALLCAVALVQQSKSQSVSGLSQADPTIFAYKNHYYLYGTNDGDSGQGFKVYTSPDLLRWAGPVGQQHGFALLKGDSFGSGGFWAPQVWTDNGNFYMAYTANEQIAIAQAKSPLGPFRQTVKKAFESDTKQIDPFVFFDDDGKKYLFHVRLDKGNRIFVARLKEDYSGIEDATLKECISASQDWENVAKADWPVTEGPTVVKHKGTYYLLYSANDFRHPGYAVGYATSNNVYGPYIKYEGNPILSQQNTGWPGSGHGELLQDKAGLWYYVFHTHHSNTTPTPRRTAIMQMRFVPQAGKADKIEAVAGTQRYF